MTGIPRPRNTYGGPPLSVPWLTHGTHLPEFGLGVVVVRASGSSCRTPHYPPWQRVSCLGPVDAEPKACGGTVPAFAGGQHLGNMER